MGAKALMPQSGIPVMNAEDPTGRHYTYQQV